LEIEQLLRYGWQSLLHPEDRAATLEQWTETVRSGSDQYQVHHRLRCYDGTYRWMLTTAHPYRDAAGHSPPAKTPLSRRLERGFQVMGLGRVELPTSRLSDRNQALAYADQR
jgi:hypothetical protein